MHVLQLEFVVDRTRMCSNIPNPLCPAIAPLVILGAQVQLNWIAAMLTDILNNQAPRLKCFGKLSYS
jgi:hypothetical protein